MTNELESAPKVPDIETLEQLTEYIKSQVEANHDYETAANALWMTAVATFNFMAGELGVTGFQASWAELQFIRETRNLKEPFALMKASTIMYPQYDNQFDELYAGWKPWLAEEAARRISELNGDYSRIHPDVLQRWVSLANLKKDE